MKGQNLRLTLGGKCVAASKTLNFHVAANVEDISSKDSSGDWAENECTGKSWDASVDAIVLNQSEVKAHEKYWNSPEEFTVQGTDYKIPIQGINVSPGQTIRSWCGSSSQSFYLRNGFLIKRNGETEIVLWEYDPGWGKNYMEWTNDSNAAVTVYPAYTDDTPAESGIVYAAVYRDTGAVYYEGMVDAMINETEFTARFVTTDPDSAKNRVEEDCYAEGTCIITDISVNAQSRQTATYSVKLQGIGALDFDPE